MDVGHLLTSIPTQHRYQHVRPGDTVRVYYRVVEGERVRTQQLQGVVMWMTRNGPNANITIRRVIQNVGVERTFLLNSPRLERIDVVRQGKVRRARLYYQRGRTGRRARIKTGTRARRVIEDAPIVVADAAVAEPENDIIIDEPVEEDVAVEAPADEPDVTSEPAAEVDSEEPSDSAEAAPSAEADNDEASDSAEDAAPSADDSQDEEK